MGIFDMVLQGHGSTVVVPCIPVATFLWTQYMNLYYVIFSRRIRLLDMNDDVDIWCVCPHMAMLSISVH